MLDYCLNGVSSVLPIKQEPIPPKEMTITHGEIKEMTLSTVRGSLEDKEETGYLLGLVYKNAESLGKAIRGIGGMLYWVSEDGTRAALWAKKFPENLSLDRYAVKDTNKTKVCQKCSLAVDTLYAVGRYGYQVKLVCLDCSRLKTLDKLHDAEREAFRLRNCLPAFLPIRKAPKKQRRKAA
jgi:hypothetical protein